ncbi:MAG: glycosyltransferase family 2 protein [Fibrobacterota bacterium]
MYKGSKVAVVVPAYNEELLIGSTLRGIPEFVDFIIIVNDCSKDNTVREAEKEKESGNVLAEMEIINLEKNSGVGGAIARGYERALEKGADCAAVMAGDGQMDPDDLPALLDPVVSGEAGYSKGNRFFSGEAFRKIPKIRYFGNAVLSLFTKAASGYWHVADSQSGYTVINKKMLSDIDWKKMYRKYGQPNDLLVRLNILNAKVKDIPVHPVYGIGERSGIKIWKMFFTLPLLLTKLFFWRMTEKYVIRDFHPLVFFYGLGFLFGAGFIGFAVRLFMLWKSLGHVPPITALACMFTFMSSSLFILFAMWFDMEANRENKC